MGNIIGGLFWLIIILTGILIFAAGLFIGYFIFKWKCKIFSDIFAERLREELDEVIDNLEIKVN